MLYPRQLNLASIEHRYILMLFFILTMRLVLRKNQYDFKNLKV